MKTLLPLLFIVATHSIYSQSLEVMTGTERIFADVQWLKAFDEERRWTLFSRSRATVDYDDNTNLFMGAYLSYTSASGFGGTLVGRISNVGGGSDAGVHYFKTSKSFVIYALTSVALQSDLRYSWFSIMRWTPDLNERWKWYTSLELFSAFDKQGHAFSVQRVRGGVDFKGYQFGLAINLSGAGTDYSTTDSNPGIFVRKQF